MELQYIVELYLKKAKEIPFTPPRGLSNLELKQEAARYCLVNGLIPANQKHLAMVGPKEFSINVKYIPAKDIPSILEKALKNLDEWDIDDEAELEQHEVFSTTVERVWIKQGIYSRASLNQTRKVTVSSNYTCPLP